MKTRMRAAKPVAGLPRVPGRLRLTQFALDRAAEAIYWIDEGAHIVYANEAACRSLGYRREELLSMAVRDIDPLYPMETWPGHWAQLRQRGSLTFESLHRRKSGEAFPVEITANYLAYGGCEYNCAFARDITERKRADQCLRERNDFLNSVLESLTHPFYVIDAHDYTIKMANSAARLGQLGPYTTCYELTHHSKVPCHMAGEACPLEQVRISGKPFSVEHVHYDARGNARVCEVHAYPVFDGSGNVSQIIEYSLDVTARRQAEEQLKQAKVAAENANRAKDHFMAVLSHELRTPLAAVIPALEALEPLVAPEAREHLEMARRNVELEARLIDDLLDVARIARGKVELDRRPVELCTVIRRAAEVCAPDIEARRLRFGLEIDGGPHWVDADAARLQQVFWNLIKNAVKFTPEGGCVGVRVRKVPAAGCQGKLPVAGSQLPESSATREWPVAACRPGLSCAKRPVEGSGMGEPLASQLVVIEVSDSGIGIEPQALARVFDAFEQEARFTTRQFGGLGLGLAISKALVEMHGGSVEAHSEGRGRGATFTVRLPICDLRLPIGESRSDASSDRQSETGNRKLHILLVEDHGDTARIIRRLLKGVGHDVQHAGDVATALRLAGEQDFDLIISDLGLPDGSGHDLLRQVRSHGRTARAIALSGYGQEQDLRQSREAGFAAHLTKPVSFPQLASAIEQAMGEWSERSRETATTGAGGDKA